MRLGIDFGTSFSLPATSYLDDEFLLLPGGVYGIPSVFYYDDFDDCVLIGEEAEDAGQGINAKNLKREIKMELNTSFSASGKTFTAKEIVGAILAKVVDVAMSTAEQKLINEELEGVVISVPAAFTHNEKEYIKQAAMLPKAQGGPELKVLGFIKEPVAAALAYFKEPLADNTKILVYDLGGGTCDIAVVEAKEATDEKFVVVASEMVRVGGKDWDERLANYITRELEKQSGLVIKGNIAYESKIRRAAVEAKHAFSQKRGLNYAERVRARVELNGRMYQVPITRSLLNKLTDDLLKRTLDEMKKVLNKADCRDCKTIICVGGSSNMPQVMTGIRNTFREYEVKIYEPEKAIALGAAIYAANCDEDDLTDVYLTDVASFTYGIELYDEQLKKQYLENLIFKGDRLPKIVKKTYRVTPGYRDGMRFTIYESIYMDIRKEKEEYAFEPIIDALLRLPLGLTESTPLYTELSLNLSGILEIKAKDDKGHAFKAIKELRF